MEYEKQYINEDILFHEITEQLAIGRQAAFVVTGMSMWPFLCHGRDQVIVNKVDKNTLKKGDIILFRRQDGKYILHRITCINGSKIQTTGDGNYYHDDWIEYMNIIAKVEKVIHNNKEINCQQFHWRFLSHLWMFLFPIRKVMFKTWFHLRPYIKH